MVLANKPWGRFVVSGTVQLQDSLRPLLFYCVSTHTIHTARPLFIFGQFLSILPLGSAIWGLEGGGKRFTVLSYDCQVFSFLKGTKQDVCSSHFSCLCRY